MNPTKTIVVVLTTILSTCSNSSAQITNPVRNIQIRTVDLVNQTVEVHNFGDTDQSLAGWRFCTHDEDSAFRYSSAGGFSGITLAAGESIFLMYNNDASASNEFNISSMGNFATPLDAEGAYAIQFYFQTPFGIGANIADFLQFSEGGLDNNSADARSSIAQDVVWSDQNAWVSVGDSTTSISLNAGAENSEINSPADYTVQEDVPDLIGDFDGDGDVDAEDIDAFVGNLDQAAAGDLAELDLNGDAMVTLADHEILVTLHVQTTTGLSGTLFGDTNLDGSVDVLNDAFALVASLGSVDGVSWSGGDFNADGAADVLNDAFTLVGNLGLSAPQ
jgi:hypothetical protein